MKYCEHCHILTLEDHCPTCNSKSIRPPTNEDLCFLIEKSTIWADMLKEMLEKHEIPFVDYSTNGAALSLKMGGIENYKLYVPYRFYEPAKQLVDNFFSE